LAAPALAQAMMQRLAIALLALAACTAPTHALLANSPIQVRLPQSRAASELPGDEPVDSIRLCKPIASECPCQDWFGVLNQHLNGINVNSQLASRWVAYVWTCLGPTRGLTYCGSLAAQRK
jgi:hypothetical protein